MTEGPNSSASRTDGAPGIADAAVGKVALGLNSLGALWILLLMIIINTDVFARALFNAPLSGVPELVALSITGIVFLQAAHSLREGRFIRSDALGAAIVQAFPNFGRIMTTLFNLIGAALFAIISWSSWPLLVKAWTQNLFKGAVGDVTFPIWPINLLIVVGAGLTALQYLVLAAKSAKSGPAA